MPEILVLSDSHRASGHLARAAERFLSGDYELIVHLGDHASDARRLRALTGGAMICVSGNCDMPSPFAPPRERIEALFGVRALICHGDRYGVKSSLAQLAARAEELDCPLALFGHTHRAFAGYVGKALLINPGALKDGRAAIVRFEDGRAIPKLIWI